MSILDSYGGWEQEGSIKSCIKGRDVPTSQGLRIDLIPSMGGEAMSRREPDTW